MCTLILDSLDCQWKTGPGPKSFILVKNSDEWEKGSIIRYSVYMWNSNTKDLLKITLKDRAKAGYWIQMTWNAAQMP